VRKANRFDPEGNTTMLDFKYQRLFISAIPSRGDRRRVFAKY
jgi:hypothetical protein